MTSHWYLQGSDGSVTGPFSERQVSADLLSGKIGDEHQVRQGEEGPWCAASTARAIFRQLAEVGWYIKAGDEIFGPFTDAKLLSIHREGELAFEAEIRQGTSGVWRPAETMLASWQQQKAPVGEAADSTAEPSGQDSEKRKWSVEPIRHLQLQVDVSDKIVAADCGDFERLLIDVLKGGVELSLKRTNGQTVGRLNAKQSKEILFHGQRGVRHIALCGEQFGVATNDLYVVMCPPGVAETAVHAYINREFQREDTESTDA